MFELIKNPNLPFIRIRYFGYVVSAALVGLGIWGVLQLTAGKARIGIDFSGGSLISVKFQSPVEIEKIREALRGAQLSDRDVQKIPNEDKFLIRLGKGEVPVGTAREKITQVFTAALPGVGLTLDRNEEVGPAVGASLRQQALKAIMISTFAILLYIWLRFDLVFGIGATLATIHDVLAVLGIFVFLGREFNLLIVTAILTIAGYSLTDTVVVYDRIRDNLKTRLKGESFADCVNRSLNEVLTRTLVTSLTVVLSVVALFVWGGEVIHDFSLTLLIGLLVGTYSSIFIATPVVVELEGNQAVKS